jgi:hypothetical protein
VVQCGKVLVLCMVKVVSRMVVFRGLKVRHLYMKDVSAVLLLQSQRLESRADCWADAAMLRQART